MLKGPDTEYLLAGSLNLGAISRQLIFTMRYITVSLFKHDQKIVIA